ncbi:MAG TPA: toll/interleukin-1 receptor domain-containing protein [Polyangiaceae bacterium]|nr:toll/interleukin-1 receptor domain-containing protein [Polyangiaceae bacterium]
MAPNDSEGAARGRIFVSHTHGDVALVKAVETMIKTIFAEKVLVSFSSSKEEGGIRTGYDWYRWIVQQVRECDVALVLLTPASVGKPWILWECGAVYGAAEAVRKEGQEVGKVRALTFQLSSDEVPSPLQRAQTVDGTNQADVEKLLGELIDNDFNVLLRGSAARIAGQKMSAAVAEYVAAANKAIRNAPLTVTEAAVQEWLKRLDDLEVQGRTSEVEHIHEWLRISFGRDIDRAEVGHGSAPTHFVERPIDLRVHRRLGEMYQAARKPKKAAAEYRLAERLAPRDLFLLRKLGKALLDDNAPEEAWDVIQRIERLDADAFAFNQECAALKGRWLTEAKDYTEAIKVYKSALLQNASSYYLCELAAQACLDAGDIEQAKEMYLRASGIISKLEEQNIWTLATGATAAMMSGDEARAITELRKVHQHNPSKDNLESIRKGLLRVSSGARWDSGAFQRLTEALAATDMPTSQIIGSGAKLNSVAEAD